MREILFRGKRVDNGEWVEGYYFKAKRHWNDIGVHEDWIADGAIQNGGWCNVVSKHAVIPTSISEFTGLADKNGKKIFEGDIINCWSEGVNAQGTVQQRRDGLWIIYPSWQKNIMWGLCPDEYSNTTVEVIGNIHDNNELIGGGENA